MTLIDAAQLGIGAFSAGALWLVWKELRSQNAFNREMLRQAARERNEMRKELVSMKMKIIRTQPSAAGAP